MNKHDRLEQTLREWGRRVDADGSEKSTPPALDFVLPAAPSRHRAPRWSVWLPILVPLGCALVAVVAIQWLRIFPAPGDGKGNGAEDWSRVYAELSRMFPDQSVWMSMNGTDMEMGMESLPGTDSSTRLVLRVELQRRSGEGEWKDVWRRDIVTAESAWVDTVSGERPEEKLSVWAYSPSVGVWMLESHLDLPEPYRVHTREQVMLYAPGTGPTVREIPLGPGLRLVQQVLEIEFGRSGA